MSISCPIPSMPPTMVNSTISSVTGMAHNPRHKTRKAKASGFIPSSHQELHWPIGILSSIESIGHTQLRRPLTIASQSWSPCEWKSPSCPQYQRSNTTIPKILRIPMNSHKFQFPESDRLQLLMQVANPFVPAAAIAGTSPPQDQAPCSLGPLCM